MNGAEPRSLTVAGMVLTPWLRAIPRRRLCSNHGARKATPSAQCFRATHAFIADESNRVACYPSRVKVNEILRLLMQDGWVLVATKGSHRQYKHPIKAGRVTVPGKPSDDLAPGTQNSILKQAGLK